LSISDNDKITIMPTYEYVCEKCKHHFEQIQPITSEALKTCPKDKCGQKTWGKGKVKRAVGGGSGLIFKGSGFYITDYRSDKYKAAAKSDAPPAPAATSSSGESKSTSGVTKPSATPAPKPAEKKSSGPAGSSSSS
jgi:putative FmdB family regulatory protein